VREPSPHPFSSFLLHGPAAGITCRMVVYGWLRGVVVRMSDLRLEVVGLNPGHDTADYFLRKVTVSGG